MLEQHALGVIVVVNIVVIVMMVADVITVHDPVGGKSRGSPERFSLAALSAGDEVDDVAASVQARRTSIGETLANAILTHCFL